MANQSSSIPLLTVSGFLASVNQTLEYAYPTISVEGEVMSFKVNQNKWVFFDLKDQGGSVGCFMSVYQLRMPIEDGMKVVVAATVKVTPWGKFSLTVQSIRPSGEGSLRKSYDLLKAKLEKEGLFAPERKRLLPHIPRHVAVISSMQAAGYADFMKILDDRWGGMRIDVAHTQVQGDAAPDQIIRAIRYFNEQPDVPEVLVIIRGGGSADDLSGFNDEQLVREIAASRIPTIVGIGHEIDETLADFAADVRAATPSNAAVLLVPDKREVKEQVTFGMRTIGRFMEQGIEKTRQYTDEVVATIDAHLEMNIRSKQEWLERNVSLLEAYSPLAVLARGYAIVRGKVAAGERILVETNDNEITAEVIHVKAR